jgi:hypothetical protein
MHAGLIPAADAEALVVLVWQLLHGVVSLRINKPGYPWRPAWQDAEQGVRALIGAPPTPT